MKGFLMQACVLEIFLKNMTKKVAKKASPKKAKKAAKKAGPKNSLVANINARKKSGTSRSKSDSTISDKAYKQMQNNWAKKK